MTSQPNQLCICDHPLSEHQRESLLCQISDCPCQRFTEKVLDRTYEELQQSTLRASRTLLKLAGKRASDAKAEVIAVRFANPLSEEVDALMPLLEVAEINLTSTMSLLETIVDALTQKETS